MMLDNCHLIATSRIHKACLYRRDIVKELLSSYVMCASTCELRETISSMQLLRDI